MLDRSLRRTICPRGHRAADILAVPEKAHETVVRLHVPVQGHEVGHQGQHPRHDRARGGYISYQGDGSMFWASKKYLLAAPKADPFVEDHLTPMFSSVLTSSVTKATLVPTLVAGGVLAVILRRMSLA